MSVQPANEWLVIEPAGGATVVRFAPECAHFLQDDTIKALGERLFGLVAGGQRRLVLNLEHLVRLDSLLLGKFVALHKKALAGGGRVVFCRLSPQLYEVFQMLQLTGFLRIYGTEAEAVQNV
jgi:anti-anti-sigma regulatory factor